MINIKGFYGNRVSLPREDGTFWVRMAFYMLLRWKSTKKIHVLIAPT
jgi:hypothetical protein